MACKCFGDRPDGETVRTIVVVPVPIARIEVEVTSVVGIATVARSGPIVTVATNIAEGTTAVVTLARGGEKVAFCLNGSQGSTEAKLQTETGFTLFQFIPYGKPRLVYHNPVCCHTR